jgi:xanthine dehydrogenase accessory factor
MASGLFSRLRVLVRGGGDLASGAIYRLHKLGCAVLVLELPAPFFVRRCVSYGEALYSQQVIIEGVQAHRADNLDHAERLMAQGKIAVLADPEGAVIASWRPQVVLDARMAKSALDTRLSDAPLVIGMGPGYAVGRECHVIIETKRGHRLGRVLWQGSAEADTGEPDAVLGISHGRVLRAPHNGHVQGVAQIGDSVVQGQLIAHMGATEICAPFAGVLRGLIHDRPYVQAGMKIGDLDPRNQRDNCFSISDKALAVGGGVLEALLSAPQLAAWMSAERLGHEA